jgi:GH25 family lysozyme M1 (1,4-beta-N-acetylmuramidase)
VAIDSLIVDVYEGDVGGAPDWKKLAAAGRPWCGAIIKCTEGVGYAPPWFTRNWPMVREAGGDRYGVDWFRGCYHYIRINEDPIKQAQLFLAMVEKAGGWAVGDLWPMVDVEGKNNPVSPGKAKIEDCVSTWAGEVERATGRKPMLYGNIYLAENGVTSHMGCQTLIVARYTPTLPPTIYNRIGWTWSGQPTVEPPTLWGWQLCGDGTVLAAGYPSESPIGAVDYTAMIVVNGADAAIAWTRAHLFAEAPAS